MKIEIKNLKEVENALKEKQIKLSKLNEQTKGAVIYLQGKVKESIARGTNAPVAVDTGRFLNSVDMEAMDENVAKVFSDLDYSKFIEFGTSRMDSRPHFRNTMLVEQANVKEVFNNKVKEAIS